MLTTACRLVRMLRYDVFVWALVVLFISANRNADVWCICLDLFVCVLVISCISAYRNADI